jgi:hypothetical protein
MHWNGYVVTEVFRVYNYPKDQWDDTIFKSYVRQFYKLKLEASGYPPNVRTDQEKQAYRLAYKQHFDIELEDEKMVFNFGMRYLAKLCLNSLVSKKIFPKI